MAHRQSFLHWVPPEGVTESQTHMITACGLDIDGSCDQHLAMGCEAGLAWTRSRDLEAYRARPMESWPPPCPTCLKAAQGVK